MSAVETVAIKGAESALKGFSVWSLFTGADFFVQLIMVLLLGASIWSWAVIFSKFLEMAQNRKNSKLFYSVLKDANNLDEIFQKTKAGIQGPLPSILNAGMSEWFRYKEKLSFATDSMRELTFLRVEQAFEIAIQEEVARFKRHIGFLATIGSASPFIGLLGTVWGIMHSFQSISFSKSTSLSVVAPGIAEALFATALGLLTAIPAVIAYNRFLAASNKDRMQMQKVAGHLLGAMTEKIISKN